MYVISNITNRDGSAKQDSNAIRRIGKHVTIYNLNECERMILLYEPESDKVIGKNALVTSPVIHYEKCEDNVTIKVVTENSVYELKKI